MADPFGFSAGRAHPAFSEEHKLPPDVYYPLVEDFLQDERYTKWSVGCKPWQLHCFGGPGCGKTTFATIVVDDLRRQYQGTTVAIASIFFQEAVSNDHASFVEDLLASLYCQVSSWDGTVRNPADMPPEYAKARRNGQAFAERIDLIREALHSQLSTNEHNFLILDGYDGLDVASRMLLDHEIKDSHLRNLSLMITRRAPAYRRPESWDVGCDNGCGRSGLQLYWECQRCGADESPQFCYPCKEAGAVCKKHGDCMTLAEPYERIDFDINQPLHQIKQYINRESHSAVHQFVEQELEKVCIGARPTHEQEHPTATTPSKPSDVENEQSLVHDIAERARRNINIAKLRIDEHATESFDDTDKVNDRLPRRIVAFFDSEIKRLEEKDPAHRNLGLIAIAAAAECQDDRGLPIHELEQWTREEISRSLDLSNAPPRSTEDIIMSANGLLVLQPYTDIPRIACYHQDFKYYVQENYNEALYQAKTKLSKEEQSVMQLPVNGGQWNMAQMTASPPAMTGPFNPQDDTESMASGQDSAYFSGNTSRKATIRSDSRISDIARPKGLFDNGSVSQPRLHHRQLTQFSNYPIDEGSNFCGEDLQNVPDNMLCTLCEGTILGSEETSGDHHRSLDELRKTITSNCFFCTELYKDVLSHSSSTPDSQASGWPRYRWTVRSTGRIGNSKHSLIVTFHLARHSPEDPQPPKRYHILAEEDIGYTPDEEDLGSSTDPNLAGGAQLKDWIKTCVETHPNCSQKGPESFVPSRLVDIQIGNPDMVRVVDTLKENIKGPYLTLSHSWGPPTFLQLTKSNKDILMGPGIALSALSKNFQETISVARFIGLKHIWIDSICIMQGPGGDFSSEGQLMHKIYRFSFCNIAIADSADSKGGLFRTRDPGTIMPMRFEADGMGKLEMGGWRILSEDVWKQELLGSKIYTRGWVFQERMLAPRILHFAKSQVFWDCSTLSACETLPEGLPHALDAQASTDRHWRGRIQASPSTTADSSSPSQPPVIGAADASLESFWKSALLNYTSCNLTNQLDKTVAIWSIAKIVRDALDEEYGGGLWENALEEQLGWRMRDDDTLGTRVVELQSVYPSWSWGSVKGAVVASDRLVPARCYRVVGHEGEALELGVEKYGSDRDKEPKLAAKALSMWGIVGKCALRQGKKARSFEMEMAITDRKPHDDTGIFDVFLDELPSVGDSDHQDYAFIILAASEISPSNGSIPRLSIPSISNPSTTNPKHLTYSGTALLLIPHNDYKAQQYTHYRSLLKEVVARSPTHLIPDPPFGAGKSIVDQTKDVMKLVAKLKERQKGVGDGGHGRHYRRVGAVHFKNVSSGMWEGMQERGIRKIWLD